MPKKRKVKKPNSRENDIATQEVLCSDCGRGNVITVRFVLRNGQKKYLSRCDFCGKRPRK